MKTSDMKSLRKCFFICVYVLTNQIISSIQWKFDEKESIIFIYIFDHIENIQWWRIRTKIQLIDKIITKTKKFFVLLEN